MLKCLNKCFTQKEFCADCNGTGICVVCKGSGFILLKDRTALRNEKRKDHQGNIIPEVINVKMPDEEKHCGPCGGWGSNQPAFRGKLGTAGPVDYRGDMSPEKGKHGDGKCKKCKGTGYLEKPLIEARRLNY